MKQVWVRKSHSFKEAEDFDARFWRRAGALARFTAAWEMVVDLRKMKGLGGGQLRLRRTVQNIKRA